MPATTIEEFLSHVPDEARATLDELRATLLRLVPDPAEKISYGVPAVVYRGRPLVGYGATAKHCALYLMSTSAMETLEPDLEGHDLGKGTIRFSPDEPLPETLLRAIVETRIAEVDAALTTRGRGA